MLKKIEVQKIKNHFDNLAQIGNLGPNLEDGFLRAGWSDEESSAMQYIADYAADHGLLPEYDAVGNLLIRTPGDWSQRLQTGSHLDTVPRGGLFDGASGIVAGLEAILAVQEQNERLPYGMELVVWRCEESAAYQTLYMGSSSAFGQANADSLCNEFKGQKLEEAIKGQGFNPQVIKDGQPTIDQNYKDSILAHLELHIEQASRLEIDHLDIGIVTSIRGSRRYRIVIEGESAHSGATPMGIRYRKDANLAMSYMQVRLNEMLNQYLADDNDLVQTIGVINNDQSYNKENPQIYESAITKVSDYAYFLLDIRSNSTDVLEEYPAEALALIRDTAQEFNVQVHIQLTSEIDPITALDAHLQDEVERSCQRISCKYTRLSSGAGHDAAVVAEQQQSNGSSIPTGMIFIPCRNGLSHHPLEFTTNEAVALGAQVIAETFYAYQNK